MKLIITQTRELLKLLDPWWVRTSTSKSKVLLDPSLSTLCYRQSSKYFSILITSFYTIKPYYLYLLHSQLQEWLPKHSC